MSVLTSGSQFCDKEICCALLRTALAVVKSTCSLHLIDGEGGTGMLNEDIRKALVKSSKLAPALALNLQAVRSDLCLCWSLSCLSCLPLCKTWMTAINMPDL